MEITKRRKHARILKTFALSIEHGVMDKTYMEKLSEQAHESAMVLCAEFSGKSAPMDWILKKLEEAPGAGEDPELPKAAPEDGAPICGSDGRHLGLMRYFKGPDLPSEEGRGTHLGRGYVEYD